MRFVRDRRLNKELGWDVFKSEGDNNRYYVEYADRIIIRSRLATSFASDRFAGVRDVTSIMFITLLKI